jgi:hypothetical protein
MHFEKTSNQEKRTAYALKDGMPVHVSEVERGLRCGCICAKCKERLTARKGNIRIHHFAHQPGSNCVGATETILHIMAKEIISGLDWIQIPPYHYERKKQLWKGGMELITHEENITSGGRVRIEKVNIERSFGDIRPDIVVFQKNKPLAIEIAVTHKVEKKKKRLFRKYKMPVIEIRLLDEHALLDRERLEDLIKKDAGIKHWLFHPRQTQADLFFLAKVRNVLAKIRNIRRRLPSHDSKLVSGIRSKSPRLDFKDVSRAERVGEHFRKTHGRYPSRDEMLRYWPDIFTLKK